MIGIITYDAPHRKTQDLIFRLLAEGHSDITVIATPFIERKSFVPLYQHRPSRAINVPISVLCDRLSISFVRGETNDLSTHFEGLDHILIAGAGILEGVSNHKLINSHPGYLPNVRGLDALKWAIYNGQPIGVTTHYISEEADEGILIERRIVPTYFEDTFHSIAQRQYEIEIEMLADSINVTGAFLSLSDPTYAPNRRMPHHLENIMMRRLKNITDSSPSILMTTQK